MLVRKRILLAAAAACAALVMPAAASAEDYCVGGAAGCTGTPVAAGGLKAALDAAQSNGKDDRFFLAPGVYSADTFTYKSAEKVQIIGAGADKTILRGSLANESVLWLEGNPDSSVSSLAVQATAGMTAGLLLQGTRAHHVNVGVYGAGFSSYGAALFGGASFDDGRVDIGTSDSYAVLIAYAGTVTGSTLHAPNGVGVEAVAGTATVQRSTVNAGLGAAADASRLTIADSVITGGMIGAAADPGSGGVGTTGTVDLDRVTIVGGKIGALAEADTGENATVHVRDSVISGVETPVARVATGGAATANVTTDRSAYPAPAQPIDAGPGTLVETHHLTVGPGFVDEAGGNFHLAANSPLIDAGTLGEPPAGAVDRDGRPRTSDGNGDCVHVSDLGAFEYQGTRVRAVAAAATATATTGKAVSFSAIGSCVPGPEAPTIRWSFDDGAHATGRTVTHAFATPGRHTATVTVSDSHARAAQASAAVEVTAAPTPGPRISRLRVTPTRVQIGSALTKPVRTAVKRPLATIGFRLSKRATVTLRFAKLTASGKPRTLKTTVRIKARKGDNRIRFAGRLSRGVAVTPGRYRLTAVATDKAGQRSKRVRTRFTAIKQVR
jgi:hypothetical protein